MPFQRVRTIPNVDQWRGPVNGTDVTFSVVGTYGPKCDPIILTDDGYKCAINWETGKEIKSFGAVQPAMPLEMGDYYAN